MKLEASVFVHQVNIDSRGQIEIKGSIRSKDHWVMGEISLIVPRELLPKLNANLGHTHLKITLESYE